MHKQQHKYSKGFTIVELLIVIVVIGILAAIVIVAFNGVQERARVTSAKSDLSSIGKLISIKAADAGTYAMPMSNYKEVITSSKVPVSGLSFAICVSSEGFAIADYRKGSINTGETLYYVHSTQGVSSIVYNGALAAGSTNERICRQIYPSYTSMNWYLNI